ncbi:acyltransferase [Streptomyces fimicarius]|uniref:Acyltransferase n=1 Tax=Streptomyces caviscabies TaxID=90079 RepID=A0ABW2M817_9ACTN|nr:MULTISPECIES: acyltransferase [Streptomyces]MCX4708547.1 acyltransferase [Streptomyces griseus]MDX3501130.1 acyltransferase [Streptomyces sp. ATCC51928]MDX3590602.1 acyltransferase [Streptomyces sp. ID03-2B]MDX5521753.1 acyltransferase [Streptomyces sp. DE06-01C]QXQ96648.1 acyltransferase [Streptomyces sp. WY228]
MNAVPKTPLRKNAVRGDVRRLAARIDSSTPAHRDRAIDGLRALALLAVPLGHWMLGGFRLDADGLHNASPLSAFGGFAPVSWVLQMLGIFFLVGGYASVLSYRRRTSTTAAWLGGRLTRLGRPVLGVTAVWAVLLSALSALGVPGDTLRTASTLVIQPLWFVGVYTVVTALTPVCVRLARRLGGWAALPLLVSVAVVDFLRYGPFAEAMPSWLSALNILPGWLFAYQLGVSWGEGRIGRRGARLLLIGGGVLFAVLLLAFHYPASMVGVPGEARTNSHPPSLLVVALAAAQSGAAILLRDRLGRLLSKPLLWAPVVVVNLSAMTILCWHQTAMLAAAVPASLAGAAGTTVAGLTTAPDTVGWLLARFAWLPVFAGLLVLIARYARRFEAPWQAGTRAANARRALAGLLAAGFAVFALGLA